MRFIAHYIPRNPLLNAANVYRTIAADTINEATKIAQRWCNKNYIFSTVKEKE